MAIIRELITRLGFTIDDAEARRYEKRLQNLGKKIRGVGRSLSLFVTAPIVALGGSFIKVAADAEETESKFKEVFQGITDDADTMAKTLAKDFDLANTTAQEMLSTTGSLLVQFGFTTDEALKMSKQVAALSVDIASFENVQGGAGRASQAITKALLGEREMLKGINKVVLEEDVTKKIAILTAQGFTFETNRQAKAVATLALVTDQSQRAIGDYARTSGSATNQSRKLRQRWIELSVTLGKVLLPLFTDLVKVLSSVVDWFTSFSPAGRKAIVIIAGIAAALGPLLIVLGSIVSILAVIPVLTIAAVAAVAALSFLIGEDIAAFIEGRKSVVGLLFDAMKGLIGKVFAFLTTAWTTFISTHVDPWIKRIEAAAAFLGFQAGTDRRTSGIGAGVPFPERFAAAASTARFEMGLSSAAQLSAAGGAAGGGGVEVTVNMLLAEGASVSPAAIAQETKDTLIRAFAEARARGAATPRLAP